MKQSAESLMRTRAALTLLVLALIGVVALNAPAPSPVGAESVSIGDVDRYQAIVARLRAGAPYYTVVGDELRRGDYATREVFNWRTPLHWTALSAVPDAAGRAVLIALGLALCAATLMTVALQPPATKWSAVVMQVGVLRTIAVSNAVVMSEAWAGVLIGLSVCAFALQRRALAVPLGLLALFVRELAAPYCVVCTIAAAVNRRWREVGAWLGGGCLYAGYYGWHLAQVWAHRLPTDLAHSSSWLEFGGLPSLMAKVQWHGWLLVTPMPLRVIALVLVVAGIGSPRTPLHVRLTSAAYVVFFLMAGKSFDGYWGLMAWPTWALACGYGVEAIRAAMTTAFAPVRSAHLGEG